MSPFFIFTPQPELCHVLVYEYRTYRVQVKVPVVLLCARGSIYLVLPYSSYVLILILQLRIDIDIDIRDNSSNTHG